MVKRLIFRSLLFCSPFFLILSLELFVLPLDFFTFRVWEALIIRDSRWMLPGRFYPLEEMTKVETGGDLGHHTALAIRRKVTWMTDRYGYRKKDSDNPSCRVVIVGDSNIAGAGLSQEEMLSEVLEGRLHTGVYPLAPCGINSLFKDPRFSKHPPRIVIFSSIERDLRDLPTLKLPRETNLDRMASDWKERIQTNRWVQSTGIFLDRLSKMNMFNYTRARLGNSRVRPVYIYPTRFGPMLFLQGGAANKDVTRDELERAIQVIESYHLALKKKGIRFIFLPIPNKENIYHEFLPDPKKPEFLQQLISELEKRQLDAVDTQKAFDESYQKDGALLYNPDDTHWNATAVRIAAGLIQTLIQKTE